MTHCGHATADRRQKLGLLLRRLRDGGIVGFAAGGDPPAPFAVTLDDAAPRQSAKPHGNRALFALGCLRPLDDASFGMVADSVQERQLARRFFSTPGLRRHGRRLERELGVS